MSQALSYNRARALVVSAGGPRVGEIIGGSERMSDPEKLLEAIHKHNLPPENYSWYIELRQFGSVPHSGFGLGLERTVAWICGIDHIRQTSPFPRTLNRMNP